jgi:protein-S-isoprenylcysteine O-methyltransferase Ste14
MKRYHAGHVAGVLLLMLGLPPFTYYLWFCVTVHGGALILPTTEELSRVPAPTLPAVAACGAWLLLQVLLYIYAPARVQEGSPQADGSRLPYRLNGWLAFWVSLGLLALLVIVGWVPATLVYDQFGPLLTTANLIAFGLSLYLYLDGRRRGADPDITGNPIYDFFLGVRLNPRLGPFDWKFFCESRPGLIGWIVVDLSLAAAQCRAHGQVSTPMLLVVAFQFLYVADYFWNEEAILSTWDIKHEKFGWMLVWGDLVWVPFTYSLQALYLVEHAHELPWWGTLGLIALNLTGYYLFRSANIQKHRFRRDPQTVIWGKPARSLRTAQGALLLTSGWWGVARHINYLGDLLMALAWCLPCLFAHPIPYFYFVYFLLLLVQRDRRDNALCRAKYGDDWEAYCREVPWRILPGIY